jgi:AmiR/NasT family two-component response regulator
VKRPRRVLIAYADEAGRAPVRTAARNAGLQICGYVRTADDAVPKVRRIRPDLCLIDLDLPGGGMRAAGEIVDEEPGVAVVVLANFKQTSTSWLTAAPARPRLAETATQFPTTLGPKGGWRAHETTAERG